MVKTQHIDSALLEQAIQDSGMKIEFLHNSLGITRQAFDKKRKGVSSFRLSEVYVLGDLLRLSDEQKEKIFFPKLVK